MAVLSLTLLTGCSDPVADDFENYLNVEMKEINADYKKLTQEVGAWENSEDDADILVSIEEILLPIVNDSLAALEDIKPETDEVKAIKEKYVKVMETYKAAFETFTDAINTQDEDTAIAAAEKLSEAVELLDEYNASLEKLAKELLENGELSVQAVATSVGYGDYNYFCKDFKRNFGISAKEYRIGCNIK